jgi:hypothetical protein
MNATEQTRLRELVNNQSALRGAGIVYQSGMRQDVVQRAVAGTAGAGLYLIVCRLAVGRGGGPSLPTSAGLRSLGIVAQSVMPLGQTRDGYAIYVASDSATGKGSAGTAPALGPAGAATSTFGTLQDAIQSESRRFASISNASKARQDTARNSIRNMR